MSNKRIAQIILITFAIFALFALGFWLRFDNLGEVDFQNDEYFHLDAATGYLKTGEFVLWDFLKEEPVTEYTRAYPYTYLVAITFSILETNEFAARLPSLIFGLLLFPLIYWIAYHLSKNHLVALASLILVVFEQALIWSSRISRMYSMFIFFFLLSSFLIFLGIEKKKIRWQYLVPGLIFLYVSYIVHESTLLVALGFFIYFLLNSIYEFFVKKNRKWNKYYILTLVFLAGLLAGGTVQFFIEPMVPDNYFELRADPNWEYLLYPVKQLRIQYFAWAVILLGLFASWQWNRLRIFCYSMILPVVLFFTFFAGRYPAKKYILFIIPFVLILYADAIYNILKKMLKNKTAITIIFVVLILLTGPIYSWPGITENFAFQKARADWIYENAELHNFEESYKYIEDNYTFGEPVIIQGARTYYFTNPDLDLITFKKDKEYTKKELKDIVESNETGWVVYPKYKEYHLRYKVKDYIKKRMKRVKDLNNTNVEVYRWSSK